MIIIPNRSKLWIWMRGVACAYVSRLWKWQCCEELSVFIKLNVFVSTFQGMLCVRGWGRWECSFCNEKFHWGDRFALCICLDLRRSMLTFQYGLSDEILCFALASSSSSSKPVLLAVLMFESFFQLCHKADWLREFLLLFPNMELMWIPCSSWFLILRLSDIYMNKATSDFAKRNVLFLIGQHQGLAVTFLSNEFLRKPRSHSLCRQVRFYSWVLFPVMVGIVGIDLDGLLCCGFIYILVTNFLHLQIGEHLCWTAELTYYFAILILGTTGL